MNECMYVYIYTLYNILYIMFCMLCIAHTMFHFDWDCITIQNWCLCLYQSFCLDSAKMTSCLTSPQGMPLPLGNHRTEWVIFQQTMFDDQRIGFIRKTGTHGMGFPFKGGSDILSDYEVIFKASTE